MASRTRSARYARRRRKRMSAVEHDLDQEQWEALVAAWGGCAYCGTTATADLQKDCMLPISRGGRYTLINVVPACRSCNASKCNAELTTWMRRKKLDESAFLVRQLEIVRALDDA
jgi:5-methylcytosine-specific restriction endonuclease McrA